jgi:PAT family beta-lactamase induction signal transducer AmpG
VAQIALFFLIVLMSFSNPKEFPILLAIIAFLVAFFGASQDIVFDAYRTEILKQSEYGVGSAVATFGYRIALIFSGAFALILSDHVSWRVVYLIMAASIGVGIIATLIGPELEYKVQSKNLKEVIFEPFFEFFKRKAVFELIGFIVLYKLDVIIALALMTPFLLELGFTATDIGTVSKGFGLVSGILGTFIGGFFLNCIGIHRSLWIFGILQAISGYCFFILAKTGYHYPTMVIAIVAENFFSGMGNAAYGAFFMLLCNPKYTATQYALLTSFMAITRTFVGFPTGWLAKHFGWENYFLIALLLSIPSFIFLLRFRFWMDHLEDRAT